MIVPLGPKNYAETLRDIVQYRKPITFNIKDTVPDMIERMHSHSSHSGGVVDSEGHFIGLVTEREIVRKTFGNALRLDERLDYLSEQSSKPDLSAWDVMIPNADTLHIDDSIEDALDLITYLGYRSMPVLNSSGSFQGIVDARELHQHDHIRSRAIMDSKDSLLSYFMGSEPYGIGASL